MNAGGKVDNIVRTPSFAATLLADIEAKLAFIFSVEAATDVEASAIAVLIGSTLTRVISSRIVSDIRSLLAFVAYSLLFAAAAAHIPGAIVSIRCSETGEGVFAY
jgi:hypothetical protein